MARMALQENIAAQGTPDNPVKAVREALGLSQEQLARKIKCSVNTVRRCEYDKRLFTNEAVLDNFQELAKQAGVELT